MGIGLVKTSLSRALIIHAIAAPIICGVSWGPGLRSP
jgi:hypothetical protein